MYIPFMGEMLECYDGFQVVGTLVDVGGNNSISLRMIMQKYPTVRKGINYDPAHMVAYAPQIPSVNVFTKVKKIGLGIEPVKAGVQRFN